jgi:hypothetical protein
MDPTKHPQQVLSLLRMDIFGVEYYETLAPDQMADITYNMPTTLY